MDRSLTKVGGMTFGIILPNKGQGAGPELLDVACSEAVDAGWRSAWVTDHLMVPQGPEADEYGTMLDGTWKVKFYSPVRKAQGRIKCGTESNGGFINITISNCIYEGCQGYAIESMDGAIIEDLEEGGDFVDRGGRVVYLCAQRVDKPKK